MIITSSYLLAYDKDMFPSQCQGWGEVGVWLSSSQQVQVAMETVWLWNVGSETEAPQPGSSLQSWVYLSPGRDSTLDSVTIPTVHI